MSTSPGIVNRWIGSKMNALGDSLTHGDVTGTGVDGVPWTHYMPELLGLSVCRNYGKNGSRVSGKGGMAERFTLMDDDADAISIFGGTNDFCAGVPLGEAGDSGTETFFGAMSVLTQGVLNKYGNAHIFFITPPKLRSTLHGWDGSVKNSAGCCLRDYRDAILMAADKYSLPVLDLYSDSGMSPYTGDTFYRPDGLHFSDEGYKRLALKIAGFMLTL